MIREPATFPAPVDAPSGVARVAVVRRVATLAEYQECVAIQRETWGADFAECVPATILLVAQKVGGVVAAAFGDDGAMLGFVFGMAGVIDGRPAHWSDMLAVRPAARGGGAGEQLKRCQRELARAVGAEAMYWTFDPLVARNAHLNLARLGARVVEYAPNLYGDATASPLHAGLPTDRLVVRWDLGGADPAPEPSSAQPAPASAAAMVVDPDARDGMPVLVDGPPDAARVGVTVPDDFYALEPARRAAWRAVTREAFVGYLGRGYRVTGFHRGSGGALPYYVLDHVLDRAPDPAAAAPNVAAPSHFAPLTPPR